MGSYHLPCLTDVKVLTRAVDGLAGSHWFMAFSSILVISGKQLELNGS